MISAGPRHHLAAAVRAARRASRRIRRLGLLRALADELRRLVESLTKADDENRWTLGLEAYA